MPAPELSTVRQFTPKTITATHFVAKAQAKTAESFDLGGKNISINLDPKRSKAAIVNQFKLSPAAARKLGRSENVVEGVASAIDPASKTLKEVRTYLTKVRVPDAIVKEGTFYFVSLRRRDVAQAGVLSADILHVSKRVPIATEQHFILGLSVDTKTRLVATIVHPDYLGRTGKKKRGGITVVKIPTILQAGTAEQPPVAESLPDPDDTQDFAACYSACLKDGSPVVLALAGVVCTACGLALASVVLAPEAIATVCVACAVALGLVLGNCLLTCHEML